MAQTLAQREQQIGELQASLEALGSGDAAVAGGGMGGGMGGGVGGGVGEHAEALEALGAENATLRAENAAMSAELSALTPQFFEEIEDLKYEHAVATEQLRRYQQTYGELSSS